MSTLHVLNQQRRYCLDLTEYTAMFTKLAVTLFQNLRQRPPKHLSASDLVQMDEHGSLTVALVSNRRIRELNRQWRSVDAPTDVLSFPLGDERSAQSDSWELGDIAISLERAQEQAGEYGHSFEREVAFLFVHGALHVLGFDHQTKAQEREMFARQHEILENAGYPRR